MKRSRRFTGHPKLTSPLKVGIAGYGVVGQRRRHFIDQNPMLETTAVCDRTFQENGIFEDGVKYFRDPDDLIKENLDILFVCMTNDIAPDMTIKGLESECHVFCEKPPGRNVADIERVIQVEKSRPDLKLKYGFNHRYHDSIKDALTIVASNDLGKVINLRGVYGKSKFISFGQHSDWRTKRDIAGGGILLDQGIHMVDLMRLFAGEFSTIHSFIDNGYWKHDVEDNAYALMRTNDGIVAMLHSSATQWRHRFQLDIALTRGSITLSGILSGSKSYGQETMTITYANNDDQGDPREVSKCYEHDSSWAEEIEEFSKAIINDTPILNGSSRDALKTMQLVYQIYCADTDWKKKWGLNDKISAAK
jgi:predicted dehydrogenase